MQTCLVWFSVVKVPPLSYIELASLEKPEGLAKWAGVPAGWTLRRGSTILWTRKAPLSSP